MKKPGKNDPKKEGGFEEDKKQQNQKSVGHKERTERPLGPNNDKEGDGSAGMSGTSAI